MGAERRLERRESELRCQNNMELNFDKVEKQKSKIGTMVPLVLACLRGSF
jgi:hypothetical protein